MSQAFENFLKSNFFGNPFNAWHDGLDTHTLTALQGYDLAKAEEMLIKALPDSRAIVGLGVMRSQKAIQPLNRLLDDTLHATDVAVALVSINGDTRGINAVLAILKSSKHWSERMNAAIALRHFPLPNAVSALLDALNDSEKLVCHHAAASLLVLYGRNPQDHLHSATSLPIRVMRETEQAAAVAELRRIVQEGTLLAPHK